MKKLLKPLLLFVVLSISMLMVLVFSMGGCRPAVEPVVEEPVVEEPVVEEPVVEEEKINIVMVATQGPNAEAAFAVAPILEDKNPDIKVTIKDIPYTDIHTALLLEFAAEESVHDIVMMSNSYFGVFASEGFIEPLDGYFENEELIDKDEYDIGDFNKDVLDEIGSYEGKLYALPYMYFPQIMTYRSDLLEQAGVEVPRTMEQYLEAVKRLNELPGIYGTAMRGQKGGAGGNVWEYAMYLYSFGGDFIVNDKLALNSPEAIKALDFWAELFKYAVPESINMGAGEIMTSYAAGQFAIFLVDGDEATWFSDPEYTEFYDVTKYDILPEGDYSIIPGQGVPHAGAWSIGINANSKHKNEAFRILTDTLSKDKDIVDAFVKWGLHPRISVLNEYKDVYPNYEVVAKMIPGMKSVPAISEWPEVEEIISTYLQKRVLGEMDSKEALDEAQEKASIILGEKS